MLPLYVWFGISGKSAVVAIVASFVPGIATGLWLGRKGD